MPGLRCCCLLTWPTVRVSRQILGSPLSSGPRGSVSTAPDFRTAFQGFPQSERAHPLLVPSGASSTFRRTTCFLLPPQTTAPSVLPVLGSHSPRQLQMQPNHITSFHGLQSPRGCLRRGSWCPAPPSASPNPLSSLCTIFVPHLLVSYLICNSFLFSDGFLGISWFKFTSPVKNHFTAPIFITFVSFSFSVSC